ncbi:phiEco32-like amidoligase-type 2 protein [Aneurinibacillus soli]|uniref:Uncharacterized protein n=1 Tax=Aneurinibacillus soli TaxID=1500254 RepID=A0A0U5BDI0_9BACL|nr:hypothetical protein [Aneurinibacillus soli]PYE57398.1 phiEco32-like amidoligase-type 2 protein [Aneurinibacillus soli]BAU28797.1 hypothetical protein CB4_02974 [Aneurinibacillus soli]
MTCFLLHQDEKEAALFASDFSWPSGTHLPAPWPAVTVQWGACGLSCQESHTTVLNGREAIENAADRAIWPGMLADAGIPTVHTVRGFTAKDASVRRYMAIVFQQEVLALYEASGHRLWLNNRVAGTEESYEEIALDVGQRTIRRLLSYAVRSVYSLGLDFGAVYAGVNAQGQLAVFAVEPTLPKVGKIKRKFQLAVEAFAADYTASCTRTVTLGADIEFVLRTPAGKTAMASHYFPRDGVVGCDRAWWRGDVTRRQFPLAELRPAPADTVQGLFRNVYRAMRRGIQLIGTSNLTWAAGGMPLRGYPIGGHIHFSEIACNARLLRALDMYVALPLLMLESEASRARRPKYGQLGDMRAQFHGGFEYRTLPSFIVSPRITRGVLALAHLIARVYRQLPLRCLFLIPELHHAFYAGQQEVLVPYVAELWEDLAVLPEYKEYEAYIAPFRELVTSREVWKEHADIRMAWKLPPFQPDIVVNRTHEPSVL